MLRSFKVFCIALAVTVLAFATVGFADANSVADQRAGSGSGTISGYTVSNIVYNLSTSDPSRLSSVNITLDAEAAFVRIKLVSASTTWYDCSVISGTQWACDTSLSPQTVASMDVLEVVASTN